MSTESFERRLAAIVAADVVGYSRLMGADETGTLARFKMLREKVIEPQISAYHGHIVKLMGDGILAEFPSVVDALACAVQIHRALEIHNTDVVEDHRIVLRIGINLGDIIIEGDDIFGDGVIIAARLEPLAEPGGICISQAVHGAVGHKLPLEYDDMGEQSVKNIAEPVRVYRVYASSGAVMPEGSGAKDAARLNSVATVADDNPSSHKHLAAAVAVVLIILGTVSTVLWWQPWAEREGVTSVASMNYPLPDKPSIAVLPFNNLSHDPAQEYFADGFTEDLTTDLSKMSGLFIISRNSAFRYKGQTIEPQQVARTLGVRYLLEGSVRRVDERIRINAQLIDASSGGHLWAERYDGEIDDIFAFQDEVTREIVAALAVNLTADEKAQWTRKETHSPEAYDAFLQGWRLYLLQTPDDFGRAVSYFEKAVELDPHYSRAYAALAATYWQSYKRLWHESLGLPRYHHARPRAEEYLQKSMQNPTPLAHQVAADMLLNSKQYGEAIAEAKRAIALQPNDADSYIALAGALSLTGQADEALDLIGKAMRLNPQYPPFYLYELGVAQFCLGQFEQAMASLERATILNPNDRGAFRLLLATYGWLGRSEDAEKALATLSSRDYRGWQNTLDPITIRTSTFWHPFKNTADAERFSEGLRRAGLPD